MTKKVFSFLSFLVFIALILFIFNNENISAAGIAGAVDEFLFFQPGLEKTYLYTVNSNTDKVMDHSIYVTGDLASYFTLSTDVLKDMAPGEVRSFTATMKLPQELEPGEHSALICVAETKTRGIGEGTIGSKVVVCAIIRVFSPYPGKHADFTFSVNNVGKNENATFNLEVTNTGTETINVYADIEIYNPAVEARKESKIVTLRTKSASIVSGQKTNLITTYNVSDLEIGEYKAKAILYYDGGQKTKEKTFRVGELYIEILEFTKEISQNKLNPINIKVQSKWNGNIAEVYASIEVKDSVRNQIVGVITSPPNDLKPWETKNLVAYWDTTGIAAGNYSAKVTLHYEGKTTTKDDFIVIKEFREKATSLTDMLLIILIVVIILLIILIIRVMKRQKKVIKKKKIKK